MNYSDIRTETLTSLEVDGSTYHYYKLQHLEDNGVGDISSLPFSIKALLESAVRQFDGKYITDEHISFIR